MISTFYNILDFSSAHNRFKLAMLPQLRIFFSELRSEGYFFRIRKQYREADVLPAISASVFSSSSIGDLDPEIVLAERRINRGVDEFLMSPIAS